MYQTIIKMLICSVLFHYFQLFINLDKCLFVKMSDTGFYSLSTGKLNQKIKHAGLNIFQLAMQVVFTKI